MDAFGDDFADEQIQDDLVQNDPAADFLAREQEELGDLADELGIANGDHVPDIVADDETDMFGGSGPSDDISSSMAEMRMNATPSPQLFLDHPKPKEEPETIRVWRENYARLLREKDDKESLQMEDLRKEAKKELSDWYKKYDEQLSKTKASNRELEKEFIAEVNELIPGTEWERVSKLCDFNAKTSKHSRDMSRMRSIMLQLKQQPPVKNAS